MFVLAIFIVGCVSNSNTSTQKDYSVTTLQDYDSDLCILKTSVSSQHMRREEVIKEVTS